MITIRPATLSDVPHFGSLVSQLGYPMTIEIIQSRLEIYTSQPNYQVYVAEVENTLAGFIALMVYEIFIAAERRARIEGIAVEQAYRKQGIGAALIHAAEQYAREKDCMYIDLTSGLRRAPEGTHEFYKKLGYHNEGPMAKLYLRKKIKERL